MVDANIIHSRIERIRHAVAKLKAIAKTHTRPQFVNDSDAADIAQHNLQVAIQCILDISNHVRADRKAGMPDDHRKVFVMLASQKVLPPGLAERLAQMSGLRNILVHEYLDVDLNMVYRAMTAELADFEEFVKLITRLL